MKYLILVLTMLTPFSVQAGEHHLVPMVGFTNWSDESGHTARATPITFEDDSNFVLGFKYLYMLDNGFAFGADTYLYKKDVASPVTISDAGVSHFHALVQYYFNSKESISPFIGAGFGFTGIAFNGGLLDDESSSGLSYELNGGVLFRITDLIGVQVEYKFTDFDVDDSINGFRTDINTDSHSLLFGVAIIL